MTMALPGNGFLQYQCIYHGAWSMVSFNTNVSTTAPGPNSGDNTVPNVPITTVNPITPISNNTEKGYYKKEDDEDEGDEDEDEEEDDVYEDEDYEGEDDEYEEDYQDEEDNKIFDATWRERRDFQMIAKVILKISLVIV